MCWFWFSWRESETPTAAQFWRVGGGGKNGEGGGRMQGARWVSKWERNFFDFFPGETVGRARRRKMGAGRSLRFANRMPVGDADKEGGAPPCCRSRRRRRRFGRRRSETCEPSAGRVRDPRSQWRRGRRTRRGRCGQRGLSGHLRCRPVRRPVRRPARRPVRKKMASRPKSAMFSRL
jgi:hypothetical protein